MSIHLQKFLIKNRNSIYACDLDDITAAQCHGMQGAVDSSSPKPLFFASEKASFLQLLSARGSRILQHGFDELKKLKKICALIYMVETEVLL